MKTLTKLLLVGFLASSLLLFVRSPLKANAEETGEIAEVYPLNQKVIFPEKSLSSGGVSYPATTILYYPDGTAFAQNEYSLFLSGRYRLEYRCFDQQNRLISEVHSFDVEDNLASFSSIDSSLSLDKTGLLVNLASSDSVVFSSILDFSSLTAGDPIISLSMLPLSEGAADCRKISLTFSERDDPASTLTYLIQASSEYDGTAYAQVAGTGQPLTGYEKEWNRLHVSDSYGCPFAFSFSQGGTALSLRYDVASEKAYVTEGLMIADLDDDTFFSKLWHGFSSPYVKLSIRCADYAASSARFRINALRGVDLSSLYYHDETAPIIGIDLGKNSSVPDALLGKAYPLFPAKGEDNLSGSVPTTCRVKYRRGYSDSYDVTVTAGSFVPLEEGVYSLLYRSSDSFGNSSEKSLDVLAKKTLENLRISVLQNGLVSAGFLGEDIPLGKAVASGGSGVLEITNQVFLSGVLIAENVSSFTPKKTGTYDIVFKVKDYLGQQAMSLYNVDIRSSEVPLFKEKPSLPRYYLAGKSYSLPSLFADDYRSGEERRLAAVASFVIDGNEVTCADGAKILLSSNAAQVGVRYEAEDAVYEKTIPLLHPGENGSMDLSRFFVGANAEAVEGGISLSSAASTPIDFANPLLTSGFSIKFLALPAASSFSALHLYLSDCEDENIRLDLAFRNDGEQAQALLNGGKGLLLSSGFSTSSNDKEFTILFDNGVFTLNGESKLRAETTFSGAPFTAFPSGKCYLSFAYEKPGAASAFLLENISGQPFGTMKSDTIKPRISLVGDYGGDRKKGSFLNVNRALSGDVLDPTVETKVSVVDPNKVVAKDNNGLALDDVSAETSYTLALQDYGTYKVSYSTSDSNNRLVQNFIYSLRVADDESPLLTVEGEKMLSLKLGTRLALPAYHVSDNFTPESSLTVSVYLVDPLSHLSRVEGTLVLFDQVGIYLLRYVVYDEEGNMAMAEITVEVTQ